MEEGRRSEREGEGRDVTKGGGKIMKEGGGLEGKENTKGHHHKASLVKAKGKNGRQQSTFARKIVPKILHPALISNIPARHYKKITKVSNAFFFSNFG